MYNKNKECEGDQYIMEIQIKQGLLRGVQEDGYTVYKGIPYAKAPVGDLRWKAPQEPEPWEGVFVADHWGNRCWQSNHPKDSFWAKEFYPDEDALPQRSEDCLNVNIWVPEGAKPGDKLPVAVWIHGGAFMHGFNCEMEMDGAGWARRGVIVVMINYRVGIYGFLAHPWLTEEAGTSGNYGLLDQIQALKWVHSNIEAWGGDPEHVTILGQSAGSMSVQSLLSSDLTEGLIHGAVMQSGAGYKRSYNHHTLLTDAETYGVEFVDNLGVKSLEELRKIPASELLLMTKDYIDRTQKWFLRPVIDGYVLKQGYDETIEKGLIPDIPIMIGSNSEDSKSSTATDLQTAAKDWSLLAESQGHQPLYIYYFTQQLLGDDAGAFHTAELWYTFETLERSWRPKEPGDFMLAKRMADYWAAFIKNGNPGWKSYTKEEPYVQVLHCENEDMSV